MNGGVSLPGMFFGGAGKRTTLMRGGLRYDCPNPASRRKENRYFSSAGFGFGCWFFWVTTFFSPVGAGATKKKNKKKTPLYGAALSVQQPPTPIEQTSSSGRCLQTNYEQPTKRPLWDLSSSSETPRSI